MAHGFLVLHKPPGPSSARALQPVKQCLRGAKVGHTGTLDPFAEGVLVVAVGAATRLSGQVMSLPKTYEATFRLGLATDTLDVTGTPTEEAPPRPLGDADREGGRTALLALTEQTPPMYSALKQGGQRLYELARKGEEVARKPRPITVYDAVLVTHTADTVTYRLTVSRGTYIRSFAETLSALWDQPVVVARLVRTAVGPFTLADALPPEQITPQTPLLPLRLAVADLPAVTIGEDALRKVLMGQKLGAQHLDLDTLPPEGTQVAVFHGGDVVGLGVTLPGALHVDRVLLHAAS